MDIHDIVFIVGTVFGSGAGCYFGLKGALNGIKDRTIRIEAATNEIRDAVLMMRHDLKAE